MPNQFLSQLDSFLTTHASRSPDSPPIAVFDCDGTIIQADVGEAMFYFQLEHFLFRVSPATLWPDFPKQDELHNLYESLVVLPQEKRTQDRRFPSFAEMMIDWYFDQLAEGATEKACSDIVRLWTGFGRTEIHQVASATLTQELASPITQRTIGRATLPKGIRYVQQAVDLFRRLQRHGFDLWAVSGSNQWSVEAVFQRLSLPAGHAIGIELLEFDGELTSQVKAPVPVLGGKVLALQQRTTKQPLIVVSDSTYDIPLFEYSSGLKILVNSQNSGKSDFFKNGSVRNDGSWLVIHRPVPMDTFT